MKTFNSFCRHKSANFVLREEGTDRKVILGHVDDLKAGDLRVTCDAVDGYLSIARFKAKASKWETIGGYWDGRVRNVPLPVAEIVFDSVKQLRLHENIIANAVMLKTDAAMRLEIKRAIPAAHSVCA